MKYGDIKVVAISCRRRPADSFQDKGMLSLLQSNLYVCGNDCSVSCIGVGEDLRKADLLVVKVNLYSNHRIRGLSPNRSTHFKVHGGFDEVKVKGVGAENIRILETFRAKPLQLALHE